MAANFYDAWEKAYSRHEEKWEVRKEPMGYEHPTHEAPSYEAPTYEAPSYEEPRYEHPTYEAPVWKGYGDVKEQTEIDATIENQVDVHNDVAQDADLTVTLEAGYGSKALVDDALNHIDGPKQFAEVGNGNGQLASDVEIKAEDDFDARDYGDDYGYGHKGGWGGDVKSDDDIDVDITNDVDVDNTLTQEANLDIAITAGPGSQVLIDDALNAIDGGQQKAIVGNENGLLNSEVDIEANDSFDGFGYASYWGDVKSDDDINVTIDNDIDVTNNVTQISNTSISIDVGPHAFLSLSDALNDIGGPTQTALVGNGNGQTDDVVSIDANDSFVG